MQKSPSWSPSEIIMIELASKNNNLQVNDKLQTSVESAHFSCMFTVRCRYPSTTTTNDVKRVEKSKNDATASTFFCVSAAANIPNLCDSSRPGAVAEMIMCLKTRQREVC